MALHLNNRGEPCNCGFGRYQPAYEESGWTAKVATSIPREWVKGEWGRGIFYPQTGEIQTWADADQLTHQDVWNEAPEQNAVHFIIRPDGIVSPQGHFAPDYTELEYESEPLQAALRAYNPDLKVQPRPQTFGPQEGPTEPSQENPSEDEAGYHNVQIRDDFQGA